MSQTPLTPGESNEPNTNPKVNEPPPPERSAPPPRRRRRRWPWVVGGLLLVLILLLVLAPTIASTAPVRSIIVGQVNKNLNGRIAIAGWSLGWTSGIKLSGLKVYDDKNAEIAHVPRITTDLSLLDAIRGKFNLGDTQIDVEHFVARIDESGRSNFEKLPKEDATATAPDKDDRLPDVSGKVTLNINQGTIDQVGNPTVHVGASSVALNIPNINQPIENNLRLAFRVGQDPAPGSLTAIGTIDAVENNRVDLEKLVANQKVDVKDVNVSAATPFLAQAGQEMELGGIANGSIQASAKGLMGLSAGGEIIVEDLLVSGPALKGDTFQTQRLSIPLQITQTVVDANTTLIKIEKLGIEMPEASIAVSGEVTQQALQRLADNQAPGHEGKIEITTNVPNIGAIANQFRNTLNLDKQVTIDSGTYAQISTITFLKDQVNLNQRADLSASGKREGRPVALKPIHMEAAAVIRPIGKPMPDINDIKLALQSEFADLSGSGESLAKLAITSTFDLEKLQRELGQFIELPAELRGNGRLALHTSGDLTQQDQPITTDLKLNLYPAGQTQQALVDVDATAQVVPADGSVPGFELKTLAVHDLKGLQQQFGALVPALAEQKIAFESGKLAANVAGSFKDDRLELTKPLAVSMPNLTVSKDGKRVISGETIRANLKGDVTFTEQIAGNLTDLSITTQSKLFSLNKSADKPFNFAIGADGAPRGSGQLALAADLKRLNDIAQAFGGQVVAPDQPRLTSGQFSGTVTLAKADQPVTSLNFNGEASGVTVVAGGKNALENEKITIVLNGSVPDDLQGKAITAEGQIQSAFVETKLSDVALRPQAGTWDMVQSASVNAQVPDLPKFYALINAFMPAEAAAAPTAAAPSARVDWPMIPNALLQQDQPVRGDEPISRPREPRRDPPPAQAAPDEPLAPLEVTSGQAALQLNVKRNASTQTTNMEISEARVSNLTLKRGSRDYSFDEPISIKLLADMKAADDPNKPLAEQISQIEVKTLEGDMSVATLTMPQSLRITGPLSRPSANGTIKLEGTLDELMPLLAVLEGAEPMPYAGEYSLTQKVASVQQDNEVVINLEGGLSAPRFKVLQAGQPAFEDQLEVKNNLGIYMDKKTATLRSLTVQMPRSNALAVDVKGRVVGWDANRQIRDGKVDLTYDLAQLWKIVEPMLTPEQRATYKDLKVEGKHSQTFTIGGSFPKRDRFTDSIRSLTAEGGLAVGLFDYSGLTVTNLSPAVKLEKGVVRIFTTDTGSQAQAKANDGAIDLDAITLDLTHPDPLLTVPKNKKILIDVKLNPVLAGSLGKLGAVVFSNASEAEGLLTVTVEECHQVPLGKLIRKQNDARARIVLEVKELHLDGLVPKLLAQAADLGREGIRGSVPPSTITLVNGVAQSDLSIVLKKPAKDERGGDILKDVPLRFAGGLGLQKLDLRDFNITIPPDLLISDLRKILPQGLVVPLRGTADTPQLDLQRAIAENATRGILGGGKEGEGPLPGLLDELLKKRDKDGKKE